MWCAEPVLDGFDVREQEQCVGTEALGQQRGGEVLVHDGLHPAQPATAGAHHRHAPAARADDEHAGALQRADEVQVEQFHGFG